MRKTAAYIAIVLAASLPVRGGEFHTGQTFYQDVTFAAWAPTGAISSITATNGGSLATGTWYYAVSATNVGGQHSSLSGETNIVVSGTNDLSVVLQWPVVSGGRGYIVWRGSATGNLTNYYEVGYATNWTDVGTNTWSNGTHAVNTNQADILGFGGSFVINNATGEVDIAVGSGAGVDSSSDGGTFFGKNAGDGSSGIEVVALGNQSALDSSADRLHAFGRRAGRGAVGDWAHAFGEDSGWGASGGESHFFGIQAGILSSGNFVHVYGYGAGGMATGDWVHAVGAWAGYGAKLPKGFFLDMFDPLTIPSESSWSNNFLQLHAADEGATQTGSLGRAEGDYDLRGSWNKEDGIIGMGGSNAIWRSREVVVQILTNAGFASTNLTLTNILYLGEQP